MKKIIVFLLLFTLICTICSCEKKDTDIRGEYAKDVSNISSDLSSEINLSTGELSLGKIVGNVYKNTFIGIGYKLDENWSFYDDEQIKELNNIAIDMVGDDINELLKKASLVYDMFATDSDKLNNINIILEKVNNLQLLSLNIADNFNIIAPTLKDGLKNMGYKNINCEIGSVEVDGKILDASHLSAEINDIKMYQTTFQKKCNGYLASITIATYHDNTISDLLNNFYWIE